MLEDYEITHELDEAKRFTDRTDADIFRTNLKSSGLLPEGHQLMTYFSPEYEQFYVAVLDRFLRGLGMIG